jgi:hypothetical protein
MEENGADTGDDPDNAREKEPLRGGAKVQVKGIQKAIDQTA